MDTSVNFMPKCMAAAVILTRAAVCVVQERAKNFGASILAPIYECLPDLLKPREGADASKAANGTAKAADGKAKAAGGKGKAADGSAKASKKQKR